jgi:hypothetical protein
MITIPAAVAQIGAQPAPVIILDTCNFLDLFRRDTARQQPRVPAEEIRTASDASYSASTVRAAAPRRYASSLLNIFFHPGAGRGARRLLGPEPVLPALQATRRRHAGAVPDARKDRLTGGKSRQETGPRAL